MEMCGLIASSIIQLAAHEGRRCPHWQATGRDEQPVAVGQGSKVGEETAEIRPESTASRLVVPIGKRRVDKIGKRRLTLGRRGPKLTVQAR